MTKLDRINFFVVDVETTGSNSKSDRITDIAVIQVRDCEIVDSFHSLINPRQPIPAFIQSMTGITNAMVRNAPEEKDVLNDYIRFIDKENSVFVAHNANFDYYFIKNSLLRRFGQSKDSKILCTVKLSRKILPKTQKVNLTALAAYYHIPVFMRHRALGDAFATARALIRMIEVLKLEYGIETLEQLLEFERRTKKRLVFANSHKEELFAKADRAPESQGVFHFIDSNGVIIFSDKADNIRLKLLSYFDSYNLSSPKMKRLLEQTAGFEYEDTPTSLHSELKLIKDDEDIAPLQLFATETIEENSTSLIYVDSNNSRGKTVSIFLIKEGLLADHLEIGKSANTNILETIIEDIYYNGNGIRKQISNEKKNREVIRKWLSKEPDLGNKFAINGDKQKTINSVKNYVRACY